MANKLQINYKKISELVPYENNPRKNDKAVDYVAKSIKEFGFRNPIIIDKNNVIVCGHTRYLACKKLGIDEVPCILADDLTDEQIKAFRLADNKVSEYAEWDINMLDGELGEIVDIDMSEFGFEIPDIDASDFGTDFDLPDGEKSDLEQITFTLSSEQAEFIREALKDVQDKDEFKKYVEVEEINENKNGNAIYYIVMGWKNGNI